MAYFAFPSRRRTSILMAMTCTLLGRVSSELRGGRMIVQRVYSFASKLANEQ